MRISKHGIEWLTDILKESEYLREFTQDLGADPDKPKKVMALFKKGLSGGDEGLHNAALTYLSLEPPINYRQVEADLLKAYGIDVMFAMALLHATGPRYETGDWSGDEEEGSVRGLLELRRNNGEYLASLSLESMTGKWILGVQIELERRVYWRSDFRGEVERDEPDVLLLDKEIPQSAAHGLRGSPLKTIVRHTVLDRFELSIEDVIMADGDLRIDIIAGAMVKTWDPCELALAA